MSKFYNLIQECTGKGTKYKQELVSNCIHDEDIKELFKLMLCPSIMYNIKKCTQYPETNPFKVIDTDEKLVDEIHMLLAADLRGNALRRQVEIIHENCTDELAQVFNWVLARKNPAQIGKTIVNKVWLDLVRTQFYMGAVSGTEKSLTRLFKECPTVNVQKKEDGMALLIDYVNGVATRGNTRQGNDIGKYFPKFMETLNHVFVHDIYSDEVTGFTGMVHHEMFCDGTDRQTGNGMISKQVKNGVIGGDVDNCIHSVTLDMYDKDAPGCEQDVRYDNLLFFNSDVTTRVKQWTVLSKETAKAITAKIIKDGGEGTVAKDPKGIFKNGKHWNNVKIKNEFVVDLKIIDYKEHNTKYDEIGSVLCVTTDNELKVWVNLKTDEDRKRCFSDYVGYIAKVKCESVILSKKKKPAALYLPRFDGKDYNEYIRDDKVIADTYREVLDQEAMSKGLD